MELIKVLFIFVSLKFFLLTSFAGTSQNIELTVSDRMSFSKDLIEVPRNVFINLIFKNVGNSPYSSHNFVLVKPGTAQEIVYKSWQVPTTYLVDSPNIIVHTRFIKPGETDRIGFTINTPGDYDYLCTYPGHYPMMRGILRVK